MFRWSGGGTTVNLAGEFNAWSTSADPMAKQADGSFSLNKKLAAGRYAYKFVVDGGNWKEDPNAKETTDDGFGGKNAVVTVGGAAGAAPAATAAIATAAPAKPAAAAVAGTGAGPAVTADGVVFRWSGGGTTVNLAGEFNAWSTSADPMAKQADGSFSLNKKLAAGRYAYKFVVDGGNWKEDPNAKETADDGYGGKNAVVTVGGAAGAAAHGRRCRRPRKAGRGDARARRQAARPGTDRERRGVHVRRRCLQQRFAVRRLQQLGHDRRSHEAAGRRHVDDHPQAGRGQLRLQVPRRRLLVEDRTTETRTSRTTASAARTPSSP